MSRWFRLYDEFLDDPKIQRLHPALLKVLLNVWCIASRNEGRLPSHADMSFSLRMTEDETFRAVSKLVEAGFIDTDATTGEQSPHAWDQRQFRSDVSTDRVREHRKRQKSGKKPEPPRPRNSDDGNDNETFPETAPETEQKQNRTDSSVAKATGTVVPHPAADFCKAVFDSGAALLVASGETERNARSIVGRWRKACGDAELLTIIRNSEIEGHSDPVGWIMAAVETRNGARQSSAKPLNLSGSRPSPALAMWRQAEAELAAENSSGGEEPDSSTWTALPSFSPS
jgi:hypothetical protein